MQKLVARNRWWKLLSRYFLFINPFKSPSRHRARHLRKRSGAHRQRGIAHCCESQPRERAADADDYVERYRHRCSHWADGVDVAQATTLERLLTQARSPFGSSRLRILRLLISPRLQYAHKQNGALPLASGLKRHPMAGTVRTAEISDDAIALGRMTS